MCRLFASQDPSSYAAETRPVRLSGHATSIRLEAAFWGVLEDTARHGEVPNFAAFLRVTCLHYLANRAAHERETAARARADSATAIA